MSAAAPVRSASTRRDGALLGLELPLRGIATGDLPLAQRLVVGLVIEGRDLTRPCARSRAAGEGSRRIASRLEPELVASRP